MLFCSNTPQFLVKGNQLQVVDPAIFWWHGAIQLIHPSPKVNLNLGI